VTSSIDAFSAFTLPNGTQLKNRMVKSAMSDSLGDGRGNPTPAQMRLYRRWSEGGVAASIVGEVQGDPRYPEKPGNLILDERSDAALFAQLAAQGGARHTQMWLQLGNAGALTPPSIGTPKGPSRLDLPGLVAAELSVEEIKGLPQTFAETAKRAETLGFPGVQIHAAHGFLLSQFLSPLFNRRGDSYGGGIGGRMRLLIETVEAVRSTVRPETVVAVKLNSSDQLEGGLNEDEDEALAVVRTLDGKGIDLLDISGGTYFPGAPSSSDRASTGPYFVDFALSARALTDIPLMATGGFKRKADVNQALSSGAVDFVGMARALILVPDLPARWLGGGDDPVFPRFPDAPPGGVTAAYTMRMTQIGEDRETEDMLDPDRALSAYERRDRERAPLWCSR